MNIYTVSFFGHRFIEEPLLIEKRIEILLRKLLREKEYIEFLVGRDGEFDQLVSYLDAATQQQVLEAMELEDCTPSFSQTVRMKNLYREGNLTAEKIRNIMAEEKANQRETVRIPKERLKPVLPSGLDARKTEEFIVKACDHYKRYLQRQRSQER